jgi:hypothetical protein
MLIPFLAVKVIPVKTSGTVLVPEPLKLIVPFVLVILEVPVEWRPPEFVLAVIGLMFTIPDVLVITVLE